MKRSIARLLEKGAFILTRPGAVRTALRRRPAIRIRLALLYGGLVLLAGIVLLGVTYGLVASHQRMIAIWRTTGPGHTPFVFHFAFNPNGPSGAIPVPKPILPSHIQNILHQTLAAQQAADLHQFFVEGAIALGLVVILALAAGWLVAGRILRPLQVMTATARRLSVENPHGRIALTGPSDELKHLADTFDSLLDRLDAALEAEKRFVANASHELRTPLTIQKALLEVGLADPKADAASLKAMAERIWQVNQRSRRLIDGLLTLAQSEQGIEARESISLEAVVEEALEAAFPEMESKNLQLKKDLNPVMVDGDRALLERLAGNLIENAVRHNVQGGSVEVATRSEGDSGILEVINTGPALPPSQVSALFEPFRRGVEERTGSARGAGLGLSIVRTVAIAHGGTVQAAARPEGGLIVTVFLPATDLPKRTP